MQFITRKHNPITTTIYNSIILPYNIISKVGIVLQCSLPAIVNAQNAVIAPIKYHAALLAGPNKIKYFFLAQKNK